MENKQAQIDKKELSDIVNRWKQNDGEKNDFRNVVGTYIHMRAELGGYGIISDIPKRFKSVVYSRDCTEYNKKLNDIISRTKKDGQEISNIPVGKHSQLIAMQSYVEKILEKSPFENYESYHVATYGNTAYIVDDNVKIDTLFPDSIDFGRHKFSELVLERSDKVLSKILENVSDIVLLTNPYDTNKLINIKKFEGKYSEHLENLLEKLRKAQTDPIGDDNTKANNLEFDVYLANMCEKLNQLKEKYNIKNVYTSMQEYIEKSE